MDSVRTCLGCRQRATIPFLLRVVAHNGIVIADASASRPGRGAWIHTRLDCLETALTRKAFGRALRKPDVAVDGDVLRQAIAIHSDITHRESAQGSPREQAERPVTN